MSIFKDTIRKVPWWAWVLFPLGLVAVLFFALRGRGSPRVGGVPVDHAASPAISPEVAEEKREEIWEDLEEGEAQAETEAEELKRKVREKFGDPRD